MPLAYRALEPVYLGRRPLQEEETREEIVQVALTHNVLLGALVQLASLVRHADDMFCDLADECQKVFDHSERIVQKVKTIKEGVGRLDSKKVPVPVGDLKLFSAVNDHHTARHGYDCAIFTPDNRPHCIKARYSVCDVTPVGALRAADLYRKDGLRSSNLFKFWPVVLKDKPVKSPDMSLPRRATQTMSFNKKYKRLAHRPKTVHSVDGNFLQEELDKDDSTTYNKVTNGLSKSQPSILVAVDTSGAGFVRMTSFRQSLKSSYTMSLDRKKRRRTVSGVPENIMREIELFERGKRSARHTPRPYSFDDLDANITPQKDEAMVQYFEELDAKIEERIEQEKASRENKLLKFLPCRRSRSLPRCVKVNTFESAENWTNEKDMLLTDKEKSLAALTSGHISSSLSLGSTSSSNSSRATKRSSIIGNKIKSFVQGTLRPRPKSLDLDVIDVLAENGDSEEENCGKLERKHSPSMPDNIMSLSSSKESSVGPGSYYYFENSTLPKTQAQKYEFAWDSLPKDWTTAVKLREITKHQREERNSSSGNWSGSSNRQSLDSARSSMPPSSTSQHSLSRDSGRGSPSFTDDRSGTGYQDYTSSTSPTSTFMPATLRSESNSTLHDTQEWLNALAQKTAAREDAGDSAKESLNRLSALTRQNIQELDNLLPVFRLPPRLDDEVSSVYSLDQEGFYTSFHNDSGLRRSTGTLLEHDEAGLTVQETNSMLSMASNNTIDSIIFRPNGAATTPSQDTGGASRKVKPPPPPRSGSCLSTGKVISGSSSDCSSVPSDTAVNKEAKFSGDSPQSESDQETIYSRLKSKTMISPQTFPSWCTISDEDNTDSASAYSDGSGLKDKASISLSGSSALEAKCVESTSFPQDHSTLDSCQTGGPVAQKTSWEVSTLPLRYLESKVWEDEVDHAKSWPRSKRTHQTPAGILKRDKSPAGTLRAKTLNFAPVVSMFDHQTSQGIEMPLSSSSKNSSVLHGSYKLSIPDDPTSAVSPEMAVHVKYQHTITVTPGKHGSRINKQLPLSLSKKPVIPVTQHYAVSPVHGMKSFVQDTSTEGSLSSNSTSSIPSLSDCGHGGYLDMSRGLGHRSSDTLSSSSSTGLSESSLTYVSMSSPNSTPTNSTLALCMDSEGSTTPVNSPALQHDTYRVSSVTLVSAQSSESLSHSYSSSSSTTSFFSDNGPVLQSSQTFSPNSAEQHRNMYRSANSFSAAPKDTVQSPLAVDSGFCSPTEGSQHQQYSLSHSTSWPTSSADPSAVVKFKEEFRMESNRHQSSSFPAHLGLQQKSEPHASLPTGFLPDAVLSPRSDSYRVAMTSDHKGKELEMKDGCDVIKTRSHSAKSLPSSALPSGKPIMSKSVSLPIGNTFDGDATNRTDSYRFAVRNTQGIVGDVATRNSSYRMATGEDDPLSEHMDALHSWHGARRGSKDIRRMGITDIDQLKCYDTSSHDTSVLFGGKSSSKSSSKSFAGINSSRKKMKPEIENLLRGDKTPPETKRPKSGKNGKDKSRTQSSTYIRFDPIFEDGDDKYSSCDTLRAQSVEMLTSENGLLLGEKVVGQLPPGKLRASAGRKAADEKAVMSILDSIKTTIRSMSSKNAGNKDSWRHDHGGPI